MRFSSRFLPLRILFAAGLGTTVLAVAASENQVQWPYNLPPHVKYYPEDEAIMKRNYEIVQRIQQEQPTVVKKMSSDPGEMFFLHYWSLDGEDVHDTHHDNASISTNLLSPALLHTDGRPYVPQLLGRFFHLPVPAAKLFTKRDFTCPSGTNACTSINRPNVCCPSSSTCQIVPNTDLGDVGCCNAASACGGSLSQCPAGYIGCPIGGGCCLPGYACFQEGCVQTSTTILFISPTPSSSSPPPPPSTITDTTTVVVTPPASSIPPANPTTVTRTETVTTGPSSVPSSSSSSMALSTSLVCSSGFRSCPASLGGGCCPTDRACGRDACPALTSTGSLEPPVRGTSSSPSTTGTGIVSGCPNGFYACSAYYPGGCCQIGRDCHSTSCPAATGVTVLNTGSVTVVAPSGLSASRTLPTGVCATGWATCDANVGGGCCPSGYACGTAACSATISGISGTQAKIAPNNAVCSIGERRWLVTYCTTLLALCILYMT